MNPPVDGTAKAAIVATVRDAGDFLGFWIQYHLSIGFSKIILFFDDPTETYISKISRLNGVIVFISDAGLRERRKSCRLYAYNKKFLDTHVMARQVLNAEIGIGVARELDTDWILHIDCDELFYSPGVSLARHISELEQKGINHQAYINHEAVVDKLDIKNMFEEVTLFKKNIRALKRSRSDC